MIQLNRDSDHFVKTVLYSFFFSIPGFLLLFAAYVHHDMVIKNISSDNDAAFRRHFIFMGLVFIFAGLNNMYGYYIIPSVLLDDEKIIFKNQTYLWNDLESLEFNSRVTYRWSKKSFIATTLIFKNRKRISFINEFYSNSSEAIDFLEKKFK